MIGTISSGVGKVRDLDDLAGTLRAGLNGSDSVSPRPCVARATPEGAYGWVHDSRGSYDGYHFVARGRSLELAIHVRALSHPDIEDLAVAPGFGFGDDCVRVWKVRAS